MLGPYPAGTGDTGREIPVPVSLLAAPPGVTGPIEVLPELVNRGAPSGRAEIEIGSSMPGVDAASRPCRPARASEIRLSAVDVLSLSVVAKPIVLPVPTWPASGVSVSVRLLSFAAMGVVA